MAVNVKTMNSLSILGAATCNLACEYCFLCNLRAIKSVDEQLVEAVKDGSYLRTVLKVIKATGNDPLNISDITFWGGESTLHLDLWTEYFPTWAKAFPNVDLIKFISNGTYNPEYFYRFIKMVNSSFDHKVIISVQLSIDGDDTLNESTRGIKTSILQNKFARLNELLASERLMNVTMGFTVKATLPIDTYNELHKDVESATKYWNYWNDLQDFFNEHEFSRNTDRNVTIQPPIITMLYEYTQQQGLGLANSLRTLDSVDFYELSRSHKTNIVPGVTDPMNVFTEMWANSVKYADIGFCGQMLKDCLIRPDGVIAPCLSGLFIDLPEYKEHAKNDPEELANISRVPSRFMFDPLNMSPDEIKGFQDYLINMKEHSSNMFIAAAVAQMFELAVAGQISPIYLKRDIALRHAYILGIKTGCYFNSLRKTGSPYLPLMGFYRLYCNGAVQYFDEKKRFYK